MVRRMEERDIEAVAEIETECFAEPWSKSSLREYVEKTDALFLVSEEEGVINGYAGMYYVYPEAYITNVAVSNAYRNRGIATEIMERMFEISQEEGVERCSLEVRVSNQSAIHLYEKLGYISVGERKNFYSQPTENALIMWKEYNVNNYQ